MRRRPGAITGSALLLGLLLHAGVCAGAASPIADYLAVRDRAIASLQNASGPADDARETAALDELQGRIRRIVGPVDVPGFPKLGDSNLQELGPGVDLGRLDGISMQNAAGVKLYVTPLPLLMAWIAAHRDLWRGHRLAAADPGAAFRNEDFYSRAFISDAAATGFGRLPLVSRPGDRDATAMLLEFSQDFAPVPPDQIAVAVIRGGRAYVFIRKTVIDQNPVCKAAWDRDSKLTETLLATYDKTDAKDEALFKRYLGRDAADADRYIRCFTDRFRSAPDYAATVRQAQALLDLLPQR